MDSYVCRITRVAAFIAVVGMLVGCSAERHAKLLVQPNTSAGKVQESFKGSGDKLVKSGAIDIHRSVPTSDGAQMDVWAIKSRNLLPDGSAGPTRGTVVVLHELGKSKASFPYFGAGKKLAAIGYDVILMDLRAHGRSGGQYITYGAKEKQDVKTVVDSLVDSNELNGDVYVFGSGLGAAVAIQYAAIDPRCKGVVAITPYKDFDSISRKWLAALTTAQTTAAIERAGEMASFDPDQASAVAAAASLKVPLMLYHEQIGSSVPQSHTQAIFDAASGPKKLEMLKPGPEQIAIFSIFESWIAEKVDTLATKKLQE